MNAKVREATTASPGTLLGSAGSELSELPKLKFSPLTFFYFVNRLLVLLNFKLD